MKKNIILILLLMFMGVCPAGCGSAQVYISEQLERAVEDEGQNVSVDAVGTESCVNAAYVHISGAVVRPGVYSLPEGSRLFDAVELAGGFAPDADEEYLNLAAVIEDGSRYHVPAMQETQEGGMNVQQGGDERVDINHAGLEELMSLTGIGEGKARAIIAYRQEHGSFASAEDIKKVSGIGEGTYNKFKDDITARSRRRIESKNGRTYPYSR